MCPALMERRWSWDQLHNLGENLGMELCSLQATAASVAQRGTGAMVPLRDERKGPGGGGSVVRLASLCSGLENPAIHPRRTGAPYKAQGVWLVHHSRKPEVQGQVERGWCLPLAPQSLHLELCTSRLLNFEFC